jgi:hypothetical protein
MIAAFIQRILDIAFCRTVPLLAIFMQPPIHNAKKKTITKYYARSRMYSLYHVGTLQLSRIKSLAGYASHAPFLVQCRYQLSSQTVITSHSHESRIQQALARHETEPSKRIFIPIPSVSTPRGLCCHRTQS